MSSSHRREAKKKKFTQTPLQQTYQKIFEAGRSQGKSISDAHSSAERATGITQLGQKIKKSRKPKCADGCNEAEFLIINGEEKTYYCSISAEAEIFEMVTDNDTITFHCSDKDKRGIQTIEIS